MDNYGNDCDESEEMIIAVVMAELAAEGLPGVSIKIPNTTNTLNHNQVNENSISYPNSMNKEIQYIRSSNEPGPSVETSQAQIQKLILSEKSMDNQIKKEDINSQSPQYNTRPLVSDNISKSKRMAIRKLFQNNNERRPVSSNEQRAGSIVHEEMIAGVKVKLPINPYPNQRSLIDNFIKSLKNSNNCILESPTGTGKTLALLCGVLAWQQYMKQILESTNAQESKLGDGKLLTNNASSPSTSKADYITQFYTSGYPSGKQDVTPEKFNPKTFGEKSIYQKPEAKFETSPSNYKRFGPYINECYDEQSTSGLVNTHKKARYNSADVSITGQVTPEKFIPNEKKETPESVRQIYDKINNMRIHSVPTIYYGARTHTQLQQVIKEFKKTSYCSHVKMSILSSRDKTCIKEFNKEWSTREDMCRACTKTRVNEKCAYFDNRNQITHAHLPNAFDIEDLVKVGKENHACPYYAARNLATNANIVFCPYNYLIDPAIRESMHINLKGAVIVIDEAHNIENQCRDAASFSFTQERVKKSLEDLKYVLKYPFAIRDLEHCIRPLIETLENWDIWFNNHSEKLKFNGQYSKENTVTLTWEAEKFAESLEAQKIGYNQFYSFRSNCEQFVKRLRDDPRPLLGIAQATITFMGALSTHLGYFFRNERQNMDDFKPVLVATVDVYKYTSKSLNMNRHIRANSSTLHLHCLNSAIIMSSLHNARCIALSSGTLSPMGSIAAELGTSFPIISSQANTPNNKVWVGVVRGETYKHVDIQQKSTRERLGTLIASVCEVTPHGVLCFVSSYQMLKACIDSWKENGLWQRLNELKHVYFEQKNEDHELMMKRYYENVENGALLFAVYRGKVSEGMDFKDHQARAIICVGIPYLNEHNIEIRAKIEYNNKYSQSRGLLVKNKWCNIQAYRAINQAAGRCIRHKDDWGAILLVDDRYTYSSYTAQLSKWINYILVNDRTIHTVDSLNIGPKGLAAYMERMKIIEQQKNEKQTNADKL